MAQRKPPQSVLEYSRYLRSRFKGIQKIYLFGSYVKGTANIDSDIDIAIVFNNITDSFDLQVELMKIRRRYDTRIEPHVFSIEDFASPYPLPDEIIKTGMEIL